MLHLTCMLHVRQSRGPRRQRGLALILMTIILVLGTSYIVVDQMNSLSQRLGQDRVTTAALLQAREALIGRAAQNQNRPGALLCPDLNNDGYAEGSCANASKRVGRLPWKSLGLPDLRDASDQRLWYAMSDAFRDTGVLNSNIEGQLSVHDGITDAVTNSKVVALIIAPGAPLSGQTRALANENTVTMYLEARNSDAEPSNVDFVQPRPSAKYPRGSCLVAGLEVECNDRLLLVTHQDLFSVVENMVARRLATDIAKPTAPWTDYLGSYFSTWGAYPFPATFTDPNSSTYVGTAGNTSGLLPLTSSQSIFTWITTPAPTIAMTGGTGTIMSADCASSTTSTLLWCTVTYICGAPTMTITARIAGIGLAFSMFTDPYTGVMGQLNKNHFVFPPSNTLTGTGLSDTATHVLTFGTLNSNDGSQTMTYAAPLANRNCGSSTTRTLKLNSVSTMSFFGGPPFITALTTPVNPQTDWFVRNQWYKLVMYAVAPGFAPGGNSSCTLPSSSCFTVNNLTGTNNKRVILVFAGRAIGSQARPSATPGPGDYFESPNDTAANRIFEQKPQSLTFNDKVVVIAP